MCGGRLLLKWLLAAVAVVALVAAWLSAKAALEKQRAENLWAASDRHAQAIAGHRGRPATDHSLQAKIARGDPSAMTATISPS